MSTPVQAARWERRKSGLGVLAAGLMVAVQDELYARLAEAGHTQLTHLHGAVIAHLDEEGIRATELARRSGRHKQVIGRLVDELETLGYVERRPDHSDRRGKLVAPTSRGLEVMRLSDQIITNIERRLARQLGDTTWNDFRTTLLSIVHSLQERPRAAPANTPTGGAHPEPVPLVPVEESVQRGRT
ncbi:MAG TPA: MarR family transcriptional regulator [Pilimelia sp.]|nr:MarR family transcriptional regulator [Pilimelia sp.]